MFVKGESGRTDAGGQRGQRSGGRTYTTQQLFMKYSGGDDQMDAAEFANSLTSILGKGI